MSCRSSSSATATTTTSELKPRPNLSFSTDMPKQAETIPRSVSFERRRKVISDESLQKALRAKSVLCPSRISIDNEPPAPTEKTQSQAFTSTACDENQPIKVESIDEMNFKNDREQTVPNRVPSPSLVSPSLVRSPSLIRYNTSPDIHRMVVGLTGTQASPGAQHQLYSGSFRTRIPSMSSSPQPFSHPLAGSPNNSLKNPQQNPPTINPYHHRTDTEMDWLYDRNAELQLEIDKLARQVKVQNMVARNEGRRAAAKIDALEAALLDMERQNAKLIAESKRARIREKREEGSEGGQGVSGMGLRSGEGQRYGEERVSSTDSIKLRELSERSSRRRSYRSPSPEEDSRTTLLPRRRSMGPHGRSLASELGLSDDQAESGMPGTYGNTGTPPVNDIPLVDLPQEEPASIPAPAIRPSSSPVASQTLSPDHIPSHIASDVSGLPSRSSTYLTPSQPEGTPPASLYSPNSFPTSRLGVRNRSRLFPSSAGSPNPSFQVWASPGSPYRSPGSTIGINSRFSGGRKTLASELANWAMDMEEDETLEEQEIEAVLHEAEARAEVAGGQDHWRTTRSGRYSLLEKDQPVYSFTSGQEVDGMRDTTTETTTTPDGSNPTGSFLGRILQRIKRFYQSTWLEIQFIWVVLIFLRRVWIEGRQGLVLRSKVKDKKLE